MKTTLSLLLLFFAARLHGQKPQLVLPIGHTRYISSVAFSPAGRTLLTGSWDKTAKLWDLEGHELQTFSGHTDQVLSVAFSPARTEDPSGGRTILTGAADRTAKLWTLDGRTVQTFSGHTGKVNSVTFSPAGRTILTGSSDSTAKLWTLDGRLLQTFSGHDGVINSVAFSPDGRTVLTGSSDHTAKLWAVDGRLIRTYAGHNRGVNSVAFSPDGRTLLTGSEDNRAILWESDGRILKTFSEFYSGVSSVAFSPARADDPGGARTILIGRVNNAATLLTPDGRILQTFSGHPRGIPTSVAFSPDGKTLATAGNGFAADLWALDGRKLMTFAGHTNTIYSVAFSQNGRIILTGGRDSIARLWALDERGLRLLRGHGSSINAVRFSPVNPDDPAGEQQILTGSADGTAKLWDLTGRELQTFSQECGKVSSVAFSRAAPGVPCTILTGCWSYGYSATLWTSDGNEIQTFPGHTHWVLSVDFSPGDPNAPFGVKHILTGSADSTAKRWASDGTVLETYSGHTGQVNSAFFSPDGLTVLTGSSDSTAKLWSLDGHALRTFHGHHKWVNTAIFSPDGRTVLTGSADGTAKLWDLTGRALQTFSGHENSVTSVAFSPACPEDPAGGRTVLTGSWDTTVKLWNTATGKVLATLIAIDSSDWVVTTPSGLFDASPGAMRQMYYLVGHEIIELEQLKERYYEPDLLAKAMGLSKEPLRTVYGFDTIALYPEVEIRLDTAQNLLRIHLSPRNGGTGKLSVFVNGKEIIEEANPATGYEKIRDTAMTVDLARYARYFLFDTLNTVSVRAYNKSDWLKSSPHVVVYQPQFAKARGGNPDSGTTMQRLSRKPKLYVLAIGTHEYASSALNLKYSAKDARDISDALRQVGAQLFGADSVSVHLLTTDTLDHTPAPTKANIEAAFDQIKNTAKAEDILAVYFSGHGVSYGDADKALFYYLTTAVFSDNLSDVDYRDNTTISSAELTRWIKSIPAGKQLLILDACNSGRVVENLTAGQKALNSGQIRALDRLKDRTGMFVLTGSAADQVSYEAGEYGQGLLTYSLLEGMKGAALSADTTVDVSLLFQHACNRVPELARGIGGIQKPMLVGPLNGSFVIGLKNAAVRISLAVSKPVFIQSYFQDSLSFDDDLGLTGALKEYFQEQTIRPDKAEFIYMDVSTFDNGYSIKGRYRREGNRVLVTGRLFRNKESKGRAFQVAGDAKDMPALAEKIVDAVWPMLKE